MVSQDDDEEIDDAESVGNEHDDIVHPLHLSSAKFQMKRKHGEDEKTSKRMKRNQTDARKVDAPPPPWKQSGTVGTPSKSVTSFDQARSTKILSATDSSTAAASKIPLTSKHSESNGPGSQSSVKDIELARPDREMDIRGKLEYCQIVLHPSFKKSQLSKSASKSVVSPKEDDIKAFMTKAIETGTAGFLYICGLPGTGKVSDIFLSRVASFLPVLLTPPHEDDCCGILC